MAKTFTITTTAIDTLRVDDKGHAEAVFTVTNATARAGQKRWAKPKKSPSQSRARLSVTLAEARQNSLP